MLKSVAVGLGLVLAGGAHAQGSPQSILPPAAQTPPSAPRASVLPPYPSGDIQTVVPTLPPAPPPPPRWALSDAQALLEVIRGVDKEGLFPGDYEPEALAVAISAGENPQLDDIATRQFRRLAQDLRDGRTPFDARIQWFVRDPDAKAMPTETLLAKAMSSHDVTGVLASLHPKHPDYAALRTALAAAPANATTRRQLLRANMERWRWLPQDLGFRHVIANVPEMQLRFVVNSKLIRSYKAVVGKPGKTATPQLAEEAQSVTFNPTWTVPQSIIKGEMMHRVGPGKAGQSGDFKWWKSPTGTVTMVQQPGPNNSLGLMRVDMPNPHAIFVHDTPARERFNQANRALSHGCVRAERASELGITLAAIFGGIDVQEGAEIIKSGKTTKVPFTKTVPVYIAYFTVATGLDGKLQSFSDIYGRDGAVTASLSKPRVERPEAYAQAAPVVANEAPGI